METIIFVKNLIISGIHGVRSIETATPRTFVFDVCVSVDSIEHAVRTDSLTATLDYNFIVDCIVVIVRGPSVNLIETIASKIVHAISRHPRARKIKLTLSKREQFDTEMISGITIELQPDAS